MGERIKRKRKEKGWGQLVLADKIGVSTNIVSFWERDLASPSLINLMCLADVFGVTIDWLVRGK